MEIDTAMDKSFFFALLAAPTAMAAEVPQTKVAVATVITPLKLLRCYQFFLNRQIYSLLLLHNLSPSQLFTQMWGTSHLMLYLFSYWFSIDYV